MAMRPRAAPMNIIIVGAGEIGRHLATELSREAHSIAVIERDQRLAAEMERGTRYFWRVKGENESGSGPWSDIMAFTTAVGTAAESESEIPTSYALQANYPNPFNPTTTIQIDLPETAHVTLAVYNVLGHEVRRLESGSLPAGRHRYTVDASNLPSGVYLYRLETPAFLQSRRMMLLK